MRQALRLLIPAAVVLALLAPGCYTIVKHPAGDGDYQAAQTSDCVRCHSDYHEYPYGYYYGPYPSYWWEYSRYGYYYAYPWWWSYYDYPYMDGDYDYSDQSPSDRDTKFGRHGLDTGPARPPHSTSDQWDDPGRPGPGLYDPPSDGLQGGGTPSDNTQGRPGTTDPDDSRSKGDSTGGKDATKSNRPQPNPDATPTVQPEQPTQTNPPADKQPETEGKKKPRR